VNSVRQGINSFAQEELNEAATSQRTLPAELGVCLTVCVWQTFFETEGVSVRTIYTPLVLRQSHADKHIVRWVDAAHVHVSHR
jgi:hypothetical protein